MKLLNTAAKSQSLSNEFRAYISDFISILRRKLNKNSICELNKKITKFSVCKVKNFPELKPQNNGSNWFAPRQQLFRSIAFQSKGKTFSLTRISRHKVACENSNTPCVPRATTSGGGTSSLPQLSLATQALQSQQSKRKEFRYRQFRMRDDDAANLKGPVLCAFCKQWSEQITLIRACVHCNMFAEIKKKTKAKYNGKIASQDAAAEVRG
jgi:hypothetical protein